MAHAQVAPLLRREIELFSTELQASHPLMRVAREGLLKPETLMHYLRGVLYLLQHSCPHIKRASRAAADNGDEPLASFLKLKEQQESGHDRWAAHDIARVGDAYAVPVPEVPKSMLKMVSYLESIAAANPAHYAAYVFFAEVVTVHAGEPWVEAIEAHCGIPRAAMTAISKHVELDKRHVEEGMHELDSLLGDLEDVEALLDAIRGAMAHLRGFLDEVYRVQGEKQLAS